MRHECRIIIWWFLSGLFLTPTMAYAETSTESGPEFGAGQWIWALFSLFLVVGLAYWATRFLAGKLGGSQTRHIKVAESLFLGQNRHLYLLLVNNQVLLVGSSEHGISLIKEYADPVFFEELQKGTEFGLNNTTSKFTDLLGPIVKGINPRSAMEMETSSKQRIQDGLEKIRSWKTRGRNRS